MSLRFEKGTTCDWAIYSDDYEDFFFGEIIGDEFYPAQFNDEGITMKEEVLFEIATFMHTSAQGKKRGKKK